MNMDGCGADALFVNEINLENGKEDIIVQNEGMNNFVTFPTKILSNQQKQIKVTLKCRDPGIFYGGYIQLGKISDLCKDTDGGINYYDGGTCTDETGSYSDSCVNGALIEYYCDPATSKCVGGGMQVSCLTGDCNGTTCCINPFKGKEEDKIIGCKNPLNEYLPRIQPGGRFEYLGNLMYCHPGTMNLTNALAKGESCIGDYECISGSCVDRKCVSISEELEKQGSLLRLIWCYLSSGFQAPPNSEDKVTMGCVKKLNEEGFLLQNNFCTCWESNGGSITSSGSNTKGGGKGSNNL